MRLSTSHEDERAELQAVLDSGILSRAPGLANLLGYICERYFAGESEQLKEYSIAVEALGRPPEFNQKQDSIVRVEAHRLRKRLKQFYAGPGASRPLEIVIPAGQYGPVFVPRHQRWQSGRPIPVTSQDQRIDTPKIAPPPAISNDVDRVTPEDARPNGTSKSLETASGMSNPPFEPGSTSNQGASSLAGQPAPSLDFARHPTEPVAARDSRTQGLADSRRREGVRRLLWLIGAVGLTVVLVGSVTWLKRRPATPVITLSAQTFHTIRMAAGYSESIYVDSLGNVWNGESFVTGGVVKTTSIPLDIAPYDADLFRRQREGRFSYAIPLPQGRYELHLFFLDADYGKGNPRGGGEASRIFDVVANGIEILSEYDIIASAGGPRRPDEKVFIDLQPASDGRLHLDFVPRTGLAVVSALLLQPGLPGKMQPLRIIAQNSHLTDHSGNLWLADRYYSGGVAAVRPDSVTGTKDPNIFRGERYGTVTYRLPVPTPGNYALVAKFAEQWFGPGRPGGGGAGSRLFNITCNGVNLAQNFDIFAEAGGANRALEKRFRNIPADPQGKLVMTMTPIRNYASINAIEVVSE